MNRAQTHGRWLLPLAVLSGAVLIAVLPIVTREQPEPRDDVRPQTLVQTVQVFQATHQFDIAVQGVVTAARRVAIQPQVTGKLVWINPDLEPGSIISSNQALFRVEESDYEMALAQQQAMLAEAHAQLRLEQGRSEVAEREWQLFQDEIDAGTRPELALREPQLAAVQAQLASAQSRYDQAVLNLSRTEVRAPFTALVEQERAALGQLVGPQAEIATLVDTSHFWLDVAVSRDRLDFIDIPGVTAASGSIVDIYHPLNSDTVHRQGQVVRLLGSLSPQGRMARLLIRIDDPLGLEGSPDSLRGLPLLLESFVEGQIRGPQLDGLIELPRSALRAGDQAWVVTADNTLEARTLEIVWRRPDAVLVRSGLADGEHVVTSPLALAMEGMQVRTAAQDQQQLEHQTAPPAEELTLEQPGLQEDIDG